VTVAGAERVRWISERWGLARVAFGVLLLALPVGALVLRFAGILDDGGKAVPWSLAAIYAVFLGPIGVFALTVHRTRIDFCERTATIWRFYPLPWHRKIALGPDLKLQVQKTIAAHDVAGSTPAAGHIRFMVNAPADAAWLEARLLAERFGATLDPELFVHEDSPD
jgi:hypothetical protein